MILTTPRSLREFSDKWAATANPNTGAGWLRSDTTSCSRGTPEAFADHAAEFWLAAGADPDKALRLARMNLEFRNTPRARGLVARAVAANASFVDSSERADRNFVFTRGREMDSNKTAAAEEFTK
jgi:hypothetical protein